MASLHESNGESSQASQLKAKRKRAAQVCTNCRRSKLRCDFQERFPEPCSRCASSGEANSRPCHVDPSHKRTRAPAPARTQDITFAPVSNAQAASPAPMPPSSSRLHTAVNPSPTIAAAGLSSLLPDYTENRQPASSYAFGLASQACSPRTLGAVELSGAEIAALFHEFFTFYHPFVPTIAAPLDPDTAYSKSDLLFWTICIVGLRPRPGHPVPRAHTLALYIALMHEVKQLFSQLMMYPCHSYHIVQALNIMVEYPFHPAKGRENLAWHYSGFAVQLGLSIGLHRPRYASEYNMQHFSLEESNERTLTWAVNFIVHQSIAAKFGYPSCLSDDFVTSSASHPAGTHGDSLLMLDTDVAKHLRIARFVLRASSALGHSTASESGQQDATAARAMRALLGGELADLENALAPMSHIVGVRLLDAKLQLYTFDMQDVGEQRAVADSLLTCYTSSIRLLELLVALNAAQDTSAVFWPTSINTSFILSTLCLLKLANVEACAPRKMHLDRNVMLTEVSTAYTIMKSRSVFPGDGSDRWARALQLMSHDVANRVQPALLCPGVALRSRMGAAGLMHDMIRRVRAIKRSEPLPVPTGDLDLTGTDVLTAAAAAQAPSGGGAGAEDNGEGAPPRAATGGEEMPEAGDGMGMEWLRDLSAESFGDFVNVFDLGSFAPMDDPLSLVPPGPLGTGVLSSSAYSNPGV